MKLDELVARVSETMGSAKTMTRSDLVYIVQRTCEFVGVEIAENGDVMVPVARPRAGVADHFAKPSRFRMKARK